MLGVAGGFVLMVVLVGLRLVQVFQVYPVSYTGLMALSVLYLLFLVWKIATAVPPSRVEHAGTPFTFLQAAFFQRYIAARALVRPTGATPVNLFAPGQKRPRNDAGNFLPMLHGNSFHLGGRRRQVWANRYSARITNGITLR